MNTDFTSKVVLVTGASAGIGEATALLFAKLGASLALVGRNADNLAAVARKCAEQKGIPPLVIVADLAIDDGCEKAAKESIAHFGRLDVLVNNAGVGGRGTIEKSDMEFFDRVFSTNVRGVYNLTRLLAPELIKTKGNIVNVSSIGGTWVQVGSLAYAMTKAALDHFTRLTALELAPKGVRVNAVSPGLTVSTFHHRFLDFKGDQYQSFVDSFSSNIPMGLVCTGEDIAKMIAFLASEHSSLVTGDVLAVDGGLRFSSAGAIMTNQVKQ